MAENQEKHWITEKEVWAITKIALQTLRNQRFTGEGIPYYKIGRSVRYKVSDVLEYMEKGRVATN